MVIRRLIASGAAIGLLLAAAIPVAAHGPQPDHDGYAVTVLVTGPSPDSDLVNGWGLSRAPGSPWWVADNGTDQSTLYRADDSKVSLKVAIPGGAPTGTVFNGNAAAGDFHGDLFLFDSEAGMIAGWRGALGTTAEIGNDSSPDRPSTRASRSARPMSVTDRRVSSTPPTSTTVGSTSSTGPSPLRRGPAHSSTRSSPRGTARLGSRT